MSKVVSINTDKEFAKIVKDFNGKKVMLAMFSALWCGPCKSIKPLFHQLSNSFSNFLFTIIDNEGCQETFLNFKVNAMPTFILIGKNLKVLYRLKSASELSKLTELLSQYAPENSDLEKRESLDMKDQMDLKKLIDFKQCVCLNESKSDQYHSIFDDNANILLSDCDEQILLTIGFNQTIKLTSILFDAPKDGTGLKSIKLYVNYPGTMDFDCVEQMEPIESISLSPEEYNKQIDLKSFKFHSVYSLVLFIFKNQSDTDQTSLRYLKFYGSPVDRTNMSDFKRITGNANESH